MSSETQGLGGNLSTGSVDGPVNTGKTVVDTNPFEDTDIHEHTCKNCGVRFPCSLPLCTGGAFDPDLCPDCEEVLEGIWRR